MDGEKTTALNDLLDRLLTEAEGDAAADPAAETVTAPASGAASPGGTPPAVSAAGLTGGLLANPALLAALPVLAENVGPLLAGLSGGVGASPKATRPHKMDRHTALLCAIKPYLSPERQGAAETVIRLCRVWDALERSGISLSGLLAGGGVSARTDGAVAAAKTDGEVT